MEYGSRSADGSFTSSPHKPQRDLVRKNQNYDREHNCSEKSGQEDCSPCRRPKNDLSAPRPFCRIRLFVRRRRLRWTFTNHN